MSNMLLQNVYQQNELLFRFYLYSLYRLLTDKHSLQARNISHLPLPTAVISASGPMSLFLHELRIHPIEIITISADKSLLHTSL